MSHHITSTNLFLPCSEPTPLAHLVVIDSDNLTAEIMRTTPQPFLVRLSCGALLEYPLDVTFTSDPNIGDHDSDDDSGGMCEGDEYSDDSDWTLSEDGSDEE